MRKERKYLYWKSLTLFSCSLFYFRIVRQTVHKAEAILQSKADTCNPGPLFDWGNIWLGCVLTKFPVKFPNSIERRWPATTWAKFKGSRRGSLEGCRRSRTWPLLFTFSHMTQRMRSILRIWESVRRESLILSNTIDFFPRRSTSIKSDDFYINSREIFHSKIKWYIHESKRWTAQNKYL